MSDHLGARGRLVEGDRCRVGQGVAGDVARRHVAALCRQLSDQFAAHPAAATGDDGDAPCELLHVVPPENGIWPSTETRGTYRAKACQPSQIHPSTSRLLPTLVAVIRLTTVPKCGEPPAGEGGRDHARRHSRSEQSPHHKAPLPIGHPSTRNQPSTSQRANPVTFPERLESSMSINVLRVGCSRRGALR